MVKEKQVCSFEQAKLFKEFGLLPKETLFMYYESSVGLVLLNRIESEILPNEYPAYTVSELQIMDGSLGNIEKSVLKSHSEQFYTHVSCDPNIPYSEQFKYFDTLAECWACKLLTMLKKEFVTVQECMDRLNK